jgi:hypothetical protein
MPGYAWSCLVCGARVGAGLDTCPTCGAPAEISGAEIERRRRARDGLPPPRRLAPRTVGWIGVGMYVAVVAAIAIFVFSPAASHMSGLLFVFPALPWPLLGHLLLGPNWGLPIGTMVGLPLNGVLAYVIGYWIQRWRTL